MWDIIDDNRRLSYEEEFYVKLDPQSNLWCIEDLSDPPKAAFTFGEFVLDRKNTDSTTSTPVFAASSFYDGGYPIDLDQDQRTIWFAYCAADFARQHESKEIILPDQLARSDVRVYGCRARMRWRTTNDLCPEKVDFVVSSDLLTNLTRELRWQPPGSQSLELYAKAVQTYLRWAREGLLRSSFTVERWTNVAGVGVPRNWNITYFSRRTNYDRIFEGRTDFVEEGGTVALPVPPLMKMLDLRVRSLGKINSLVYNVTNGQMPSLQDPKLTRLADKLSKNARQMPRDLRKPRSILYILFVILFAMPLILFFAKRRVRGT